jgi:hypothetical protein
MVLYYQMIYFPETDNTIKHDSCYGYKCSNYYIMHNNTHSGHKRLLVMWRARLLCFEAFCYVYPPPLSEANCPPFPPPGKPGPRLPRWLPFPQDPHTPSPHRPLQYPASWISLLNHRSGDVGHACSKCVAQVGALFIYICVNCSNYYHNRT